MEARTLRAPSRRAIAALVAVVAAILALVAGLAWARTAPSAYADGMPQVGDEVTGRATIGWSPGITSDGKSFFPGTTLDTGDAAGATFQSDPWCTRPGATEPNGHEGDYTARVTDVDFENQTVTYYVSIVPDDYDAGYQSVAGIASLHVDMGGYGRIHKSSADPSLTDGNACYDLSGAVYDVYSSDGTYQTSLTTGSDGWTDTTQLLPPGDYYAVESMPAKGYALDADQQSFTIANGETAVLETTDQPQNDPSGALVQKLDGLTGKASPEGNGSLSGAQFTVNYYANANGDASGNPNRTWVFETDANGYISFAGDTPIYGELYHQNGKHIYPLGTYTVQETKAPSGYVLPANAPVHKATVTSTGTGVTDAKWTYDDSWNKIELNGKTAGTISDRVQQGDYRIVKEVSPTVDNENPNGASDDAGSNDRVIVPGIKFELVNASGNAVTSPETGKSVEPGGTVCTITTDEDGLASTRNADANGWSVPDGWTGALAYGDYTVHEVVPSDVNDAFKAKYGHDVPTVPDFKATISSDGQYDPPILANDKSQTPLRIVKVDAETGKQVPEVCSFQLCDADGNVVTYTSHYPDEQTMDTWTTNEKGEVTLPFLLNPGTYTVKEAKAPDGYVLDATGVELTVDSSFRTWDDPLTVTYRNVPSKGRIAVAKTDSQTGSAVKGAVYEVVAAKDVATPDGTVRAKAGDVVATVTTGEDGKATTDSLYLGSYTVTEKRTPDGYALDATPHDVTLASAGETVAVTETSLDVKDAPTTLTVLKSDSATGAALPGATFRLWDPAADAVCGYADADAVAKAMKPDAEDASASIDDPDALDAAIKGASAGDELDFRAALSTGTVTMMQPDGTTGEASGVALKDYKLRLNDDRTMTVLDGASEICTVPAETEKAADPNAYSATATSDDKGIATFANVPRGTYEFEETAAPEGYSFDADATARTVTVDDNGLIAAEGGGAPAATFKIELENTPVSIQTTASVDGAKTAEPSTETVLTDEVAYKGLTPGKQYTVTGTLHEIAYDEDGTPHDAGTVKDADGKDMTASKSFTPEAADGTVAVTFTFDSSALSGKDVVAFETAERDGKTVAAHADIADDEQTVRFKAGIHTTLTDTKTGSHTASAIDGETVLVDTVTYGGLDEGATYTLSGTLMDKATGDVVKDADGNDVTATATFTATGTSGTAEVYFKFDGKSLGGHDTVAFEELRRGDGAGQTGKEDVVADHRDLSDDGQTVSFPGIHTTATDAADGDHEAAVGGSVTIDDDVAYTGLTPGREYTVRGTLMDKSTGSAVTSSDGAAVESSATFTPDASDGTATVTFTFDASDLGGHDAVAFEDLYDADTLMAQHEDIDDSDQTVSITTPGTTSQQSAGSAFDKTGDWMRSHWPIAALIAAVAIAGGVYGVRKRRAAADDEIDIDELMRGL